MNRISVVQTARDVFSHLGHKWVTILRATWVPALLACIVLYVALHGYFQLLEKFVEGLDARSGGVMLGLLSAGILVWLYFWSVVAVAAGETVTNPTASPMRLRMNRLEWRLYAAMLRVLMAEIAFVGTTFALASAFGVSLITILWNTNGEISALALRVVLVAGVAFIFVRLGFLTPAIAVTEAGPITTRAWHLSRDNTFRILLLSVLLFTPGLVLYIAGELLMRVVTKPIAADAPLGAFAAHIDVLLPLLIALLVLVQWVTVILLTIGSAFTARSLVRASTA